jgi:hypothetical protein
MRILRRRTLRPTWPSMSLSPPRPISSTPAPPKICRNGLESSVTSTSTSRSSSLPSRSILRSFSRVAPVSSTTALARGVGPGAGRRGPLGERGPARQQQIEQPLLGVLAALGRTLTASSSLTSLIETSMRSRTIESTSRPT